MVHTKELVNLVSNRSSALEFEEETVCPICKNYISPKYISSSLNTEITASVFNYCSSCHNSFVSYYDVYKNSKTTTTKDNYSGKLKTSEPCKIKSFKFEDSITILSPQFNKIYNQALAAESYGLDEIAGLGYRKSLEFLVKDFAIHLYPEKAEEIKQKLLSPCIKDYITDPSIKMLATKSAWIGNDEAHYTRKQENRDINDMKRFISAIVHFISIILITEDAATIEPK